MADLLAGFDDCPVDLDGVRISARRAGAGRPFLLLHGYPQTMVMWHRIAPAMATSYFHWFFLTVGDGLPEKLINGNPAAWIDSRFAGRQAGGLPIEGAALAEYQRVFTDPRAVHATCEDYRAAAGPDLDFDQGDYAAGLRVRQPLLALWGASSYVGRTFDVAAIWRSYATAVSGRAVNADHYLAEEAPPASEGALRDFLAGLCW